MGRICPVSLNDLEIIISTYFLKVSGKSSHGTECPDWGVFELSSNFAKRQSMYWSLLDLASVVTRTWSGILTSYPN